MKKIMIAFAMISLIFAFCHAETIDTSPYLGTWIDKTEGRAPDFTIEILHIAADHQAYFIHQAFNRGAATYSVKKAGIWQESAEGVEVIFDENEFNNLSLICDVPGLITVIEKGTGEKKYFTADAADMLSKMAEEELSSISDESTVESGVFVPGGYYIVGVDIPAGDYSVRRIDASYSQNFVVYEAYNEESGRYTRALVNSILNNTCPQLGKITLRENNIVWVDEGVYFDAPIKLGF